MPAAPLTSGRRLDSFDGVAEPTFPAQTDNQNRESREPALDDREILRKNIRDIAQLEQRALRKRSAADRASDAISRAMGNAPFALFHFVWFGGWFLINGRFIPGIEPFDPFPFSFLTLVVSLEAIFLSVFVLMSQNHLTRQSEKRAHLDLQVNMLAEQELTAILRMVQGLCEKHGVEVLARDGRIDELVKETDVHAVAAALEDRLPGS